MRRKWLLIILAVIVIFLLVRVAIAPTAQTASAAQARLATLVGRPDVVSALIKANGHDHSLRHSIDKDWIAEYRTASSNGAIAALLATNLSRSLATDKSQSTGQIEQIMVFDVAGCLVAADHPTHDYDQSDEDKWKRTVGAQVTKPFVEARDQGPKGYTDQVSQAVTSGGGEIIGGVTLRWCNTRGGCI